MIPADQTQDKRIAFSLADYGLAVQTAENADVLLRLSSDVDADVALLEWGPTDRGSIELLSQLRTCGASIPVVLLSPGGLSGHRSLALDNGASDFILKSQGVDILVRRLKQAAARHKHKASAAALQSAIVLGKLHLDPKVSRAFWDGNDVGLTLGEYNIVYLLASMPGRFVTFRAIYDRLRRKGFIAGHGQNGYWGNVRSAIMRIRKKFCACDSTFDDIDNHPGFGYCWKKPD